MKKLSNLPKKIAIFIAINVVIAGAAALAPPSLMNSGYTSMAHILGYVDSLSSEKKVSIILGDSRSEWRIESEDMGFTNLSVAGSTPVEGYYYLNRAIAQGAKVDRLILSYGPFHIFTQDSFHAWTRYFGLIDAEYTDTVLEQAAEFDDAEYLNYQWPALEVIDSKLPWLPAALKFRLVNVLSIDATFRTILTLLIDGDLEMNPVADPSEDAKFYSASVPARVATATESPEFSAPSARSLVNEYYLARLVELATQNNIEISFLVMPFNRDVAHPPAEYYDRYLEVLENAGLKGCISELMWWPNDRFLDSHHLNSSGVSHFNEGLENRIKFCRAASGERLSSGLRDTLAER